MVMVGKKAPDFTLASTKDLDTLDKPVSLADYAGKWLILFFYPLDFTPVCPTEIRGFNARLDEFKKLHAEVLAVSTDSVYSHKAWLTTPPEKNGLGPINFPLASDATKQAAREYGVLIEEMGVALRGLFIIDPEGVLRYMVVSSLNIGRSVEETLRVLQALQTGGACPLDWQPGDRTL